MDTICSRWVARLHFTASRATLETLTLLLILLLGGVLRSWNATVGLPVLYEHDEIFEVHRSLELLRGEYNFYRTKGMYFYFLSLIGWIYGGFEILQGTFPDLKSFITYSLVHPGEMVLLSRYLCSTFGVISIFLIYRLGKQNFSTESFGPLLLALAWATCGLASWVSRWGLIESTVVLFSLLAFSKILLLFENRSRLVYMWAGFFIAAATATKVYGILLFLPLVFAHVMVHDGYNVKTIGATMVDRKLMLAFSIFALSLLVFNPSIPVQLVKSVDGGILPDLSADTEEIYPLFFYFQHVRWNLGNLGLVFFCIGAIAATIRFNRKILTCAIFALSFFLVLGLKKEAVFIYERYLLASLPFFFLISVYGLEVSWRWVRDQISLLQRRQWLGRTVILVAALGFMWNGLSMLFANPVMGHPFVPVHQQAMEWFTAHVPGGATVVIRGEARPWPGNQNLPIFDLKENYLRQYEEKRAEGRTPAEIDYFLDLAQANDVTRYNLVNETRYVLWKTPQDYIGDQGAEYFVVDVEHFDTNFTSRRSYAATESRRKFYRLLRSSPEVTLAKAFHGYTITGGARTIEVYKVIKPRKG